jgi:hypothetical protein
MSDELSDEEKAQLRTAKVWSANDNAPLEDAAVKLFRLYAIIGQMVADMQTMSMNEKLFAMRFLGPLIYADEYHNLHAPLHAPQRDGLPRADDRPEDRAAPDA